MSDTHYSGDTPYGHVEFDHADPNLTEQQFLALAKIHSEETPKMPGFGERLGQAFSAATQNPAIKPVINALTLPGRETEALGAGIGSAVAPAINAFRSGERQQMPSIQDVGEAITGQFKGNPSQAPGAKLGAQIGSFADPVSLLASEVGGEALKPMLGKLATKILPTVLEHEAGIPAQATLTKLKYGKLPNIEPSVGKAAYASEIGKVIDRPTQNALIDQLAKTANQPKIRAPRRAIDIGDIDMSKIPKSSELGAMIDSQGIETPILSRETLAENASKLRNLQSIANDSTLRKGVGDRKLLTEAYNLRRNLDYSIDWKPTTGSTEDAWKQANQDLLKSMRHQANELIENLPGGDVIRKADEQATKDIAGQQFNKGFNRPSAYRAAGFGAAPFILSRLGLPMPVAILTTMASQSPKAIGKMMDVAPKMLKPSIVTALQSFRKMLAGQAQGQE